MRKFLSKYMDATAVDQLEAAYKEKNPDAKGLPEYIPKSRFDEKSGALTEAEKKIANFEKEKNDAVAAAVKPLQDKLKDIPDDWQQQLKAAQDALETQKTEYEGKLTAASNEASVMAQIYGSGARNVKAVRALIDVTKPIDEQLKELRKSDAYLFNSRSSKGTGKGDDSHGGEGDEEGSGGQDISVNAMYRAVGITPPAE